MQALALPTRRTGVLRSDSSVLFKLSQPTDQQDIFREFGDYEEPLVAESDTLRVSIVSEPVTKHFQASSPNHLINRSMSSSQQNRLYINRYSTSTSYFSPFLLHLFISTPWVSSQSHSTQSLTSQTYLVKSSSSQAESEYVTHMTRLFFTAAL